ncbi:hypothetical protein OF83DRAFT_412209 [Amylostereum chailletii]|nr:hypothetical protein OF83DRAFT_412209 [Amylostereum chailletii]
MESDGKTVPASACIPPELWVEIFQFAVYVPGFMDTDVPNPFTSAIHSPPTEYYDMPNVRRSIRTRHALNLVCRTWSRFSRPLLYEAIYIASERSARHLLRTFEETDQDGRLFGAWTRHLLIGALVPAAFVHLPGVARHLPHLSILSIWNLVIVDSDPLETPIIANEDFAQALAKTCGNSLHKLFFHAAADVLISDSGLQTLLQASPGLHTLIVRDGQYVLPVSLPPLPSLTFLSVDSLSIIPPADAPVAPVSADHSFFPSLNHILTDILYGPTVYRAFLNSGFSPAVFTLDLRRSWSNTFNGRRIAWSKMETFWPLSPSTTHLHVILGWRQSIESFCQLPPSATHLAIFYEFPSTPFENRSPEFLADSFRAIALLGTAHPTLKAVRLTNPVFVAWLREVVVPLVAETDEGGVGSALALCATQLRVEDHAGEPIVPPYVLERTREKDASRV